MRVASMAAAFAIVLASCTSGMPDIPARAKTIDTMDTIRKRPKPGITVEVDSTRKEYDFVIGI